VRLNASTCGENKQHMSEVYGDCSSQQPSARPRLFCVFRHDANTSFDGQFNSLNGTTLVRPHAQRRHWPVCMTQKKKKKKKKKTKQKHAVMRCNGSFSPFSRCLLRLSPQCRCSDCGAVHFVSLNGLDAWRDAILSNIRTAIAVDSANSGCAT
jgi:hypothetical protein